MKKIVIFLYFVMVLGIGNLPVSAEELCSNSEISDLSKLAYNVNFDYEMTKYKSSIDSIGPNGEIGEDYYYASDVNVYNLVKRLKIEILNKEENQKYSFSYEDAEEGILYLTGGVANKIKKIEFRIYGTGGCNNELLRTTYMTIPKWNEFSTYDICKEIPDYYMCQSFVSTDYNMSEIDFNKKAEEYAEEQENENSTIYQVSNFLKEHWMGITIGVVSVVIVGTCVTIFIVRKKRRRLV